jgi:hypothetical protein
MNIYHGNQIVGRITSVPSGSNTVDDNYLVNVYNDTEIFKYALDKLNDKIAPLSLNSFSVVFPTIYSIQEFLPICNIE